METKLKGRWHINKRPSSFYVCIYRELQKVMKKK